MSDRGFTWIGLILIGIGVIFLSRSLSQELLNSWEPAFGIFFIVLGSLIVLMVIMKNFFEGLSKK